MKNSNEIRLSVALSSLKIAKHKLNSDIKELFTSHNFRSMDIFGFIVSKLDNDLETTKKKLSEIFEQKLAHKLNAVFPMDRQRITPKFMELGIFDILSYLCSNFGQLREMYPECHQEIFQEVLKNLVNRITTSRSIKNAAKKSETAKQSLVTFAKLLSKLLEDSSKICEFADSYAPDPSSDEMIKIDEMVSKFERSIIMASLIS